MDLPQSKPGSRGMAAYLTKYWMECDIFVSRKRAYVLPIQLDK